MSSILCGLFVLRGLPSPLGSHPTNKALLGLGAGGAKPTVGIWNFNLRRSKLRKSGRLVSVTPQYTHTTFLLSAHFFICPSSTV